MDSILKDEKAQLSYALGINIAEYLRGMPIEPDLDLVIMGLRDLFARAPKMSQEEYNAAMQLCQQKMRAAAQEKAAEAASKMKAASEAFLAENAKKEGCDFSGCESDQDYLDAIEAFEDERNKPSTEPTAEERIAAAMEYQNALAE